MAISLLGAAIVLSWTFSKANDLATDLELHLVSSELQSISQELIEQISSLAISDDAYQNIEIEYSSQWAHDHLTYIYRRKEEKNTYIILNRHKRPIFAYRFGYSWLPSYYNVNLKSSLDSEVTATQKAYLKSIIRTDDGDIWFDASNSSISRSTFVKIDDEIAFAALVAVAPSTKLSNKTSSATPSVVIVTQPIDKAVLARIEADTGLRKIHLSTSADPGAKPKTSIPLAGPNGATLGYIDWESGQGLSTLITILASVMGVLVTMMLGITIYVLRHMVRTTDELAFSEACARQASLHDSLSGLPNRILFTELATDYITQAKHAGNQLGLIYLDLDHFKEVNDTLGHPIGDQLIQEIAHRLKRSVNSTDLVARLSGDEFLIMLAHDANKERILKVCRQIDAALTHDLVIGEHILPTSASIGVAIYPEHGEDLTQLMRRADIALYKAKEQGRGRYTFFEPDMDETLQVKRQIEEDMRIALEKNEFIVYYQPVIRSSDDTVVGVEALIRWAHPEKGLLSPAFFLPVAEQQNNLMNQLGMWVLKTAMKEAKQWPDLSLAVNVSPTQLRHPSFASSVKTALQEADFDANLLELEVTEAIVMDHTLAAKRVFNDLIAINVRIALDDFGTGYSSLSYLRQFQFHKFKIDRSFIINAVTEPEAAAIVETLINLGSALGMTVTAEGVETQEQSDFLKSAGCSLLQGFYFSKPLPAHELTKWLSERKTTHR